MIARSSLIIFIFVTCFASQNSPVYAQQNIAQLLTGQGLSRIIDNKSLRNSFVSDVASVTEKYDKDGKLKSKDSKTSSIQGKPKLNKLDVDDLYQAFATRYDFYIDIQENTTAVVNGLECAVIKFRPKPNLATKETADQFINRLNGTIYVYVSANDTHVVKIDGFIENHFNFMYWALGFIPIGVDVYKFKFSVEYSLFNNIPVETSLTGIVDYEIRNRGSEEYKYTINNYRVK